MNSFEENQIHKHKLGFEVEYGKNYQESKKTIALVHIKIFFSQSKKF